jgi:hypothetical protein
MADASGKWEGPPDYRPQGNNAGERFERDWPLTRPHTVKTGFPSTSKYGFTPSPGPSAHRSIRSHAWGCPRNARGVVANHIAQAEAAQDVVNTLDRLANNLRRNFPSVRRTADSWIFYFCTSLSLFN